MSTDDSVRRDDLALAILLLLIGVPRVILAAFFDRPLGAEGTLSIVCVALALMILFQRRRT